MFSLHLLKGTKGFALFNRHFLIAFKFSGELTVYKGSSYRIVFQKHLW